jgi:predicted acetyltransferase
VPIEIRRVPDADLQRWAESVSFANSEELSDEIWRDVAPTVEPDRTLGAYDGDELVGGGSIFSFDTTVPGGAAVPSAGITWIGIMPTHRRQGALRALMTSMIANARERREPLAVLWASEGSIYQRFGYGLATLSAAIDLERERALFNSMAEPFGRVRLVNVAEARQLFPPIFERSRARIPGFYTRNDTWWKVEVLSDFKWGRRGFERKFYAVHENDSGVPDAYAMYRVKQDWTNSVPGSELYVQEIMASDGAALREMWRFLFGVDLVKRITTRNGTVDEPLLLMVTEPRRVNLRVRDGLWLRVIDVVEALTRRAYSADGSVVLRIDDSFLPDQAGSYRLTTSGGAGTVERTQDAADIELEAADLGAIYLGMHSLDDLARAGRTRELTAGARARADAMLHWPIRPWCPETF